MLTDHVTYIYIYAAGHTYIWGRPYVCMRYVTRAYESCHTCLWVMSHVCMRHATCIVEACHAYLHVMPHIFTTNSSKRAMSQICLSRVCPTACTFTQPPFLIAALIQVWYGTAKKNKSYPVYLAVIFSVSSRTWLINMRRVTHIYASCHTYL